MYFSICINQDFSILIMCLCLFETFHHLTAVISISMSYCPMAQCFKCRCFMQTFEIFYCFIFEHVFLCYYFVSLLSLHLSLFFEAFVRVFNIFRRCSLPFMSSYVSNDLFLFIFLFFHHK